MRGLGEHPDDVEAGLRLRRVGRALHEEHLSMCDVAGRDANFWRRPKRLSVCYSKQKERAPDYIILHYIISCYVISYHSICSYYIVLQYVYAIL